MWRGSYPVIFIFVESFPPCKQGDTTLLRGIYLAYSGLLDGPFFFFFNSKESFCYIHVYSRSRFSFVGENTTLYPMISWVCVILPANSDFLLLFFLLVHFVSVFALKSLSPFLSFMSGRRSFGSVREKGPGP